jgi:hypothetical protein
MEVSMKKFAILLAIVVLLLATVQQVVASSGYPADQSELDLAFWNSIKDSTRASEYQAYLNKFPNGTFAELARDRVKLYSNPANASKLIPAPAGPREIAKDGRFIAYENHTVLDTKTKLMWADSDNSEDIEAIEGEEYCEKYQGGDYRDWRMPTTEEIMSLTDSGSSQSVPYKCSGVDEEVLRAHITQLIDVSSVAFWSYGYIDCHKGKGVFQRNYKCHNFVNVGEKKGGFALSDQSACFRVLPVRSPSPEQGRDVVSNLRSSYRTVSSDESNSMLKRLNFYDRYDNSSGSGISHQYQARTISGDRVVIDGTTGLMWHQSGSDKWLNYTDAQAWLSDLNRSGYAGYSDWRLPTSEEGASLLESSKKNGDLYIDPVFSNKQCSIWTGDSYSSAASWVIYFDVGYVNQRSHGGDNYVRPVRSGK